MKISDDELAQLQKLFADADKVYLESDKCHWQTSKRVSPEAVAAALVELQQLREERRWRPISELKEYEEGKYFQLATKDSVNPCPRWHVDGELRSFAEPELEPEEALLLCELPVFYDAWRPLPMDLPEVE